MKKLNVPMIFLAAALLFGCQTVKSTEKMDTGMKDDMKKTDMSTDTMKSDTMTDKSTMSTGMKKEDDKTGMTRTQ